MATTLAIISAIISVGSAIYAASQTPPDQEDIGAGVTKSGSNAPRNRVYGRCRVNTSNVYSNVLDSNNAWRLDVFHVGGVGKLKYIHQVWIDDKQLLINSKNIDTNPLQINEGIYKDNDLSSDFKDQSIKVQFRNGSRVERAMELCYDYEGEDYSDGEWTINHRGDSVPQFALVANRVLSDGIAITGQTYNAVVEVTGGDVDDGLAGFTDSSNPAFALLDYLTNKEYGLGVPYEYINTQSFINTAIWCDTAIAGGLRIDAEINSANAFSDNILDILSTMGGSLFFDKGLINLGYEFIETPIYTITLDDILKDSFSIRPVSSENKYNCVTTSFKSAPNDEQEDSFILPVDVVNNQEILRTGEVITQTIEMPFTIDGNLGLSGNLEVKGAVKYFTNREYAKRNVQQTCTLDLDLNDYPNLTIWSVHNLVNPIYWDGNKEFRVLSMTSSTNDERFNIATIEFVEYSDDVYIQTQDGNGGSKPKVKPARPTAPSGLTFIQETWINDGYGSLSWQPTFYSHSIRYDVAYKLSSETDWVQITTTENEYYKISGLKSTDYDFRVRVNDYILGTSGWSTIEDKTIAPPTVIPPIQNLVTDFTGSSVNVIWDDALGYQLNASDPTSPDGGGASGTVRDVFSHYLVNVLESTTHGSEYIQAKSFSTTDNFLEYSFDENSKNGINASRYVRIEITIISKTGAISSSVVFSNVQNTQCQAPSGYPSPNVNGTFGTMLLKWDTPPETDYFATRIYASTTSGYTPSVATLIGEVASGNSFSHIFSKPEDTSKLIHYIKFVHIDKFGPINGLIYSPELLFTEVTIDDLLPDFPDELQDIRNPDLEQTSTGEMIMNVSSADKKTVTGFGMYANDSGGSRFIIAADEFIVATGGHSQWLVSTSYSIGDRVSNKVSDIVQATYECLITNTGVVLSNSSYWKLLQGNSFQSAFYLDAATEQLYIRNATIANLNAGVITAGTIDADRIGATSINASKLEANTITANEISANTITANEISANTITANEIVSNIILGTDATFKGTLEVKSAVDGERIEIVGDSISVYDSMGTLRVKIGNLA